MSHAFQLMRFPGRIAFCATNVRPSPDSKEAGAARADSQSIVWVQRGRGLRLTRVRGVPVAGEALSLGDLFGGHPGGVEVAVPHRVACVMWVSRLKTM